MILIHSNRREVSRLYFCGVSARYNRCCPFCDALPWAGILFIDVASRIAQRPGGDRCAAGQIPHPRRAGLKPERREFGMTIGMVGGVEAAISPVAPLPPPLFADRRERH